MLQLLTDPLLSLVFPQQCSLCPSIVDRTEDGIVCSACWSTAKTFTGLETICVKCGAFLSSSEPLFDVFCHACSDHFYETARAVAPYEGAFAKTILHLKNRPVLPARVADLVAWHFREHFIDETTLIVPVPLSRQRMRERGFNQAEVIAKALAARTSLPTDGLSLIRRSHTAMHRAGMDTKARQMSVKNAFEIKRPRRVAGHSILLVDDVLTSGATASACAKALKQKGADRVNVLTLARAG
ncbi:MAG TPA: ComF family protein [Pyrinomonadaceae bacterium]|nr:ComF family protein [Pyrinomonadaceae bacterium]HMP66027.1 ComF family protein [Pyrinomonadaceae bacterium]